MCDDNGHDTKQPSLMTGKRNQQLDKKLPSRFILVVTVGGVVGLGILRGPGEIAAILPQPSLYLLLWFIGGLFVLLSTAVIAELLAMTSRSGGTYVLVRRAYGGYPGFVMGWVDWLSFSADLALKAVVVIEFTAILFPQIGNLSVLLAILVTTIFALIQSGGVTIGAAVQETATSIIGLSLICITLWLMVVDMPTAIDAGKTTNENRINDWSLVIATIIFTYDGWLYGAYFGEEIEGKPGIAARSCIKGMVLVIALYMLLNTALVKSTGLAVLAGSDLAVAKVFELANMPMAEMFVIIAAIFILLGHQNLGYMSGSRILYALAADDLATKHAQRVGTNGNPVFAVFATWFVAVLLIFIGGFEFLLLLSVFFYVPIYLALIIGVIVLRRREPKSERPYRAWGHPYSTVLCLVGWLLITLFQGYAERETAIYAVLMIAASWPVYRYVSR